MTSPTSSYRPNTQGVDDTASRDAADGGVGAHQARSETLCSACALGSAGGAHAAVVHGRATAGICAGGGIASG